MASKVVTNSVGSFKRVKSFLDSRQSTASSYISEDSQAEITEMARRLQGLQRLTGFAGAVQLSPQMIDALQALKTEAVVQEQECLR
jgi:hypothetical protein